MRKLTVFVLALISVSGCSFAQPKKVVQEYLKIDLPSEYKWKVISNQEDSITRSTVLIPGNESPDKWTIVVSMSALKNDFKATNIDSTIGYFLYSSLQQSSDAKYKVLEKNEKAKNFWGIFKVETPHFPNDPKPESQLWYIKQGDSTLYVNFVAVKEKNLSNDFVSRWSNIFKSSVLVNK